MATEKATEKQANVILGEDKIPAAKTPQQPWEKALAASSPLEYRPDMLMVLGKDPAYEYYFAQRGNEGKDVSYHLGLGYEIVTGDGGESLNYGAVAQLGFGQSADGTLCVGDLILMRIRREGHEAWQTVQERHNALVAGEVQPNVDLDVTLVRDGKSEKMPMPGANRHTVERETIRAGA